MFKLQELRNPRKLKWPIYFVFGLIIISFIFFYGWQSDPQSDGPRVHFARMKSGSLNPFHRWNWIGGQQMQMARLHEQAQLQQMLPPAYFQLLSQQGLLDDLVSREDLAREAANAILLEREADAMGVHIAREEIIESFRNQPDITDETLNMMAVNMGLPNARALVEYYRELRERSAVETIKSMAAHASLFELWQEYSISNEALTLRMAGYPNEAFTDEVVVNEQELQDYLDAHREEFHVPPQRRYAYIKVSREALREEIVVNEELLQTYYQQNQSEYFREAGLRAQEIYVPINEDQPATTVRTLLTDLRTTATANEDWAQLAQRLNAQYPETNLYYRNTPWLTAENPMRPQRMEVVNALADNEISTPILTENFGALARISERREGGVPPLAEVRDRVESAFLEQQTDQLLSLRRERLREMHEQHDDIGELAQAMGIEDRLTTAVNEYAFDIPEVGNLYSARDYLAMLHPGELSDVIDTGDSLIVLQLREEIPEHDPTLEEVRGRVEAAVRDEQAGDLARAAAEQGLSLVEGGASFDEALADAPNPPFLTEPFTRAEPVTELGSPLIGFTTQTLRIDIGSVGLSPYGQFADAPQGYAVWRLEERQTASMEDFMAERYNVERRMQIQRLALLNEWLAEARREAGFEYVQE